MAGVTIGSGGAGSGAAAAVGALEGPDARRADAPARRGSGPAEDAGPTGATDAGARSARFDGALAASTGDGATDADGATVPALD
jgi:hypothetical protein